MKGPTYGDLYELYVATDPINVLSFDDWLSAGSPTSDPPGLRESIAAAAAEAEAAQAAIDEEANRPDAIETATLAAGQSLIESQRATMSAREAIEAARQVQLDASELTSRLTNAEQVIARPRPAPPVLVEQTFTKEPGPMGRITGATQVMSDGTTRTGVVTRDESGRPASVAWS